MKWFFTNFFTVFFLSEENSLSQPFPTGKWRRESA